MLENPSYSVLDVGNVDVYVVGLFMPPNFSSKGHIGLSLSVCPVQCSAVRELRLALGQEPLELGS